MAFYLSLIRPFRLTSLNIQATLLELVVGVHYLLFFLLDNYGEQDAATRVKTIMTFDAVGFGVVMLIIVVDCCIAVRIWFMWRLRQQVPVNVPNALKGIGKAHAPAETSAIGLLDTEKKDLNYESPNKSVKKDTLMKANNADAAEGDEVTDLAGAKKKDSSQATQESKEEGDKEAISPNQ